MPKFKMPLQKKLLQVGEVMVLINGDTCCHGQGIYSDVYVILIMQKGRVKPVC